jgi:hypothetical protein
MAGRILDFFRPKSDQRSFSESDITRDYELKQEGLERILGPMFGWVGHAIIPYEVGGPVHMYYFPQRVGTALATMQLLRPDGSGPKPSRIGTYELVAFTRHAVSYPETSVEFQAIENRIRGIFTNLGRYSEDAELNPNETCELPAGEGQPSRSVIFDSYPFSGPGFTVGKRRHGLLLCVEVHRSEMDHARSFGTASLVQLLDEAGVYPFSDLDRPVVTEDA